MQLKLTTDYAIRIILYLAANGKTDSKCLSDRLKISRNYIKKLMSASNLSRFVISTPGKDGGLELRRPGDEITLLDIITSMENKVVITQCLEEEPVCDTCTTFEPEQCPVRQCYGNIQTMLEEKFSQVKISSLTGQREENGEGESLCSYSQ